MLQILKRLSGIKYLYVFVCFPYIYRAKIGISDAPRRRVREVAESLQGTTSLPVKVWCVFALPLLNARATELALHGAGKLLINARMPYSSGHTEWFYTLNLITGVFVAIGCYAFGVDCCLLRGFVVVLLPLPFDAVLFAALLSFAQYAFIYLAAKLLFISLKLYSIT